MTLDRRLRNRTFHSNAAKITRAVRSVELHGLGTPNCLERRCALWLLRPQHAGELHIGGAKADHLRGARVGCNSRQVLNDSGDVHIHYARFERAHRGFGASSVLGG